MTTFPTNLFGDSASPCWGWVETAWPRRALSRRWGPTSWRGTTTWRRARRRAMSRCATCATGDFAFDALVMSPGIPHALPMPHPVAARARAWRVPILSDAELLFRAVRRAGSRARFVGITGTNGKSTTTALLAHILARPGGKVAAGGNLGPASLALKLLPDNGTYVLEMSSYMLEQLATLRFDAAAMLNLSADHLDRHGDMAGYVAAKRAIFDRQAADDLALVGVDDDALSRDGGMAARPDGAGGYCVGPQCSPTCGATGACCATWTARSCQCATRRRCPVRTMRRMPPPLPRSPVLRCVARRHRARPAQLPRSAAPPAAHRHDRRDRLRQRQQGDQRRRRGTRPRLLRQAGLDRRRDCQGRRHRSLDAAIPAHRARVPHRPRRRRSLRPRSPRTV